jgi:hypothetical protein
MISPSKEDILNRKIEIIKGERRRQYKSQSDPLYIEYQKDLALGNTDKAELDKEAWLAKVKEIEENNPYPTE